MAITAQAVKELRERTGAGMMDCKKALVEADGDMDAAIKVLRTRGLAAAAKKAQRTAKDGLVAVAGDTGKMAVLELNCETDFVARNEDFQQFTSQLVEQALAEAPADADAFKASPFAGNPGQTVEAAVADRIATIGENIVLSRVAVLTAEAGHHLGSYLHMGGKIGVVVEGTDAVPDEALHDVAMHVAASEPRFTSRDQVTEDVLSNEREIALQQAMDAGKPEHIAQRIVDGKMEKFFSQEVLLEQPFAKDPDKTVGEYLRQAGGDGATVTRFERFKLGEAS